jgi:predicted transcriptional regulator
MKTAGLLPPRFEVDGFFSICFTRPHEAINEAINEAIKIILAQLLKYSNANLKVLESATGFSRAKLQRYISLMKKDDLLRYVGSLKNGHYEITEKGRTTLKGKT